MSSATHSGITGKIFSTSKYVLLILGLLLIQAFYSVVLGRMDSAFLEPPMENLERWNPALFKSITFGHTTSAVDWLWLKVLQDQGISHVELGKHPSSYYDLQLATDLDPEFLEAYTNGANLLAVIRNDGLGAMELLKKGEDFRVNVLPTMPQRFKDRFWAREWSVPLLMGYTALFELNDMKAAAKSFIAASEIKGSPAYLKDLAQRLEKPGGEYEVGLKLLDFLMTTSKEERVKEGYRKKKESLYLGQLLYQINEKFRSDVLSKITPAQLNDFSLIQKKWENFCAVNRKSVNDPFGGEFKWDSETKKIVSTTPHQHVFGLD